MAEKTELLVKSPHRDILERKYILCCIPSDWVLVEDGSQPTNSAASTVILLLNNMIGSGILAQAYVFKSAGILAATVEYAIIGLIVYFGAHFLIKAAIEVQIFEYGELAQEILGDAGRLCVDISTFVGAIGALVAYVIIVGTLSSNVVTSMTSIDSWYTSNITLSVGIVTVFVAPLCLIRRFGHLAYISYASIGAVTSVMLLVVTFGSSQGKIDDNDALNWISVTGTVETVGTVIFAFGYANAIFHAYSTLRTSEAHIFSPVCALTTYLGVCLCYVTGLVGYYCFRSNTNADILENFSGTVGGIFKVIIILHLILYIPGDFVIMRHSLFKLLGHDASRVPDTLYIASTFGILATVTLLANVVQAYSAAGLTLVLQLTGGITGSFLYFLLPGLCTIRLFEDSLSYYSGLGLAIVGIGVAVMVGISAFW